MASKQVKIIIPLLDANPAYRSPEDRIENDEGLEKFMTKLK